MGCGDQLRKLSSYFEKVDVTNSKLCKNPEEALVLPRMEQGKRSFAEFLVRKGKAQEQVPASKGTIGILGIHKESGMKDFKRKIMQLLPKNLGRNNGRDNLSFLFVDGEDTSPIWVERRFCFPLRRKSIVI